MNTNLHTEQQKLILDFHQNLYKTVVAKQYDKGSRFVPIQCTADGVPFPLDSSYIVEVKVLTPDHRALLEDSAAIQEDGSLLLELTENMLYCPGKAKVEIVIYDAANQQRLSPMNFDLLIEGSVYDDDRVTATDEFNALTDYVFKVGGLSDTVHEHISETDLHLADDVRHITEAERTKWDNILEGYIYNDTFYSDSEHTAEITGETGKLYIDLETNKTYRWSGSAFVVIAEANQNAFSHIVADSTAIAAGSQTDTLTLEAGANITLTPDAENNAVTISSQDTVYTHPTTPGNRHIPGGGSIGQVLKWSEDGTAVWGDADVPDSVITGIKGSAEASYRTGDVELSPANLGLENVDNKSSETIRSEITSQNVTDALGYVPADQSSTITTDNIAQQSVKYATSATSATTATKLGSSTVGGTTKPIYLNAGTATACSTTVGNANTPVYLNNGTITSTGKSFANYLPLSGGNMTGSLVVPSVELSSGIPFIDFHYNSSSADYTGRIAQYSADEVTISPHIATNNIRSDGSVNIAGTCSAGMFKNGAAIVLAAPNGTNVVNSSNSGYTPINASAFTINSSRLVKENLTQMSEKEARKLLEVNVVDFDYKEEFGGTKGQHGVIAEEIIDIIPSCVTVPEGYSEEDFDLEKGIQNKTLSVDYSKLVPHLIKMTQLLYEKTEQLQEEINALKQETVVTESSGYKYME